MMQAEFLIPWVGSWPLLPEPGPLSRGLGHFSSTVPSSERPSLTTWPETATLPISQCHSLLMCVLITHIVI